MSYTNQNARTDLAGLMHSKTGDRILNIDNIFNRAARSVLARIHPEETRRIANLSQAVHDDVYRYSLPSDFGQLIDLRPQGNRERSDNFTSFLSEEFGIKQRFEDNIISLGYDSATKFINISYTPDNPSITIHSMDSVTANGTWAVGDDAENLAADSQYKVTGSNSLNFDLSGAGTTGYIEISDMSDVDLSDHKEVSSLFVWVYLPDSSIITNAILRWGNDTSNYWSRTVTTQHDSTALQNGWNLLRFDWNGATETGTVDEEAIDYLRLTITYNGTAETDIRVDNIISSLGDILEIEYYSKYLFRNSSGTFIETTTDTTDIINLDVDSYNIFLYEAGILAAQQELGAESANDINFFRNELYGDRGLYARYLRNHPLQNMSQQSSYYDF